MYVSSYQLWILAGPVQIFMLRTRKIFILEMGLNHTPPAPRLHLLAGLQPLSVPCFAGEIELADVSGQVKNLLQNQHCYASELLSEREICVLLSVTRGEGSSEVVFTPLLKDEGVINPKFLAKLGNWEDSKVSSTRVKSKKAGKKTVLLEVPSAEGKRSPSPQGNRTKTMVSSPKQSRRA
ncbi:transmembrane protease serine 9 [Platysternon megacephalum]|uniref:Transmembrane protease serine 9 n=1 Tax=Platysternon megacephalum TaxID=55544 RepID=A0A4D9E378_9SAUR|nr:transmembrane protease serine 9 [Platysternon megacephalum]